MKPVFVGITVSSVGLVCFIVGYRAKHLLSAPPDEFIIKDRPGARGKVGTSRPTPLKTFELEKIEKQELLVNQLHEEVIKQQNEINT